MDTITGKQIKKLRTVRGQTRDEFAASFDVSGSTVYNYEQGITTPNSELQARMKKAYDKEVAGSSAKETNGVSRSKVKRAAKVAQFKTTSEDFAESLVSVSATVAGVEPVKFQEAMVLFASLCIKADVDPVAVINQLVSKN